MNEDTKGQEPEPVTCSGGIRLGLRTAPAPAPQDEEAASDGD